MTTEMNCLAGGGGKTEEVTIGLLPSGSYINVPTNGKAIAVWFKYHRNSESDKYYCAIDGMPVAFYSEGGTMSPPTFGDSGITTNFKPYSADAPNVTECWVIYI